VPDPPGPLLFIGAALGGDGTTTPAVHQVEVGGSRSWLDMLPAVYRKDPIQSDFLDRFLRLIHSVQEETTRERTDLVRRFDPFTAADSPPDGVLDDLAGWLAAPLDERWPRQRRRAVVARAFAAQGMRATPLGLRAAIHERFSGLGVTITEPAQRAAIWALDAATSGEQCCGATGLGFDTMLTAAPADGAVVGADAIVEQSTLAGDDAPGAPLFADLAHRFHVGVVPNPGGDPAALDTALRTLIDAEKPAHTVYTLCVAAARARVGVQARVGVDAIVAGPRAPLRLDGPPDLAEAALAAAPTRADGTDAALVGQARVGKGRLT
jgi:phage tail-like protein